MFHRADYARDAEQVYRSFMSAADDTYTKVLLDEAEMPTQWYNVIADLPAPPPPPLHPGTHEPVGPDDLAPLFPLALIEQEVTSARHVDIPGGVIDVYRLWRPSPLFRARRLERLLDTPAKIFYKYEGVSPPARTSRTRPCPRPTTTTRKASAG